MMDGRRGDCKAIFFLFFQGEGWMDGWIEKRIKLQSFFIFNFHGSNNNNKRAGPRSHLSLALFRSEVGRGIG